MRTAHQPDTRQGLRCQSVPTRAQAARQDLQAALALDHADGSLWLVKWTQYGDFYQFDKSGNLLSTVHYPGLIRANPLGGEFAIPGPAALPLLVAGGLFATKRRRRE